MSPISPAGRTTCLRIIPPVLLSGPRSRRKFDNELNAVAQLCTGDSERIYLMTHRQRFELTLEQVYRISSSPMRILDVGCYPYYVGAALEMLGHEVHGISSPHEPMSSSRVAVLNVENEHFPFDDGMFDLVLFNEIIEHLPQTPVHALRETWRVARPGGHLMVTTPNLIRSLNRGLLFTGHSVMYPIDLYFEEDGRGCNIYRRHNREYTLPELRTVVERTGWNVMVARHVVTHTPWRERMIPDPWWLHAAKVFNYALMLSIPSLRDTLMLVARKP